MASSYERWHNQYGIGFSCPAMRRRRAQRCRNILRCSETNFARSQDTSVAQFWNVFRRSLSVRMVLLGIVFTYTQQLGKCPNRSSVPIARDILKYACEPQIAQETPVETRSAEPPPYSSDASPFFKRMFRPPLVFQCELFLQKESA